MNSNILKILSYLISCPSVTPESAGAIEYIAELLQNNDFEIDIQKFGPPEALVTNLYAKYGFGRANICFAGHIDVVPPGDLSRWEHDPFKAKIVGNKVLGRGAVDMKGSLACMLGAALEFTAHNPAFNGSLSFLITSDEEGLAAHGTKQMLHYLNAKNEQIDFVILGEPTSEQIVGDTIKIGRRGSINFSLTVKGRQGHVAYPLQTLNPITILINILAELNQYSFDQGSKFFQSSNLEITNIEVGNSITNVIPAQATAQFNIRFNNLHSEQQLIKIVDQITSKYSHNYQLTSRLSADCFIQNPEDYIESFKKIVDEFCQVEAKFSTSGGTSDARFIKNYCAVVEFGLLHKTAHQVDEHTEISDLQKAYDVYYNCLNKFLLSK